MAHRAFISYDYDYDASLKNLLLGQAKNPDSPFEVVDWSIKLPSRGWKTEARQRIRASGLVIVLCGKHTRQALGVAAEVAIAQQEGIAYFLLAGYRKGSQRPVTAKRSDRLYEWTWPNLQAMVDGHLCPDRIARV